MNIEKHEFGAEQKADELLYEKTNKKIDEENTK